MIRKVTSPTGRKGGKSHKRYEQIHFGVEKEENEEGKWGLTDKGARYYKVSYPSPSVGFRLGCDRSRTLLH